MGVSKSRLVFSGAPLFPSSTPFIVPISGMGLASKTACMQAWSAARFRSVLGEHVTAASVAAASVPAAIMPDTARWARQAVSEARKAVKSITPGMVRLEATTVGSKDLGGAGAGAGPASFMVTTPAEVQRLAVAIDALRDFIKADVAQHAGQQQKSRHTREKTDQLEALTRAIATATTPSPKPGQGFESAGARHRAGAAAFRVGGGGGAGSSKGSGRYKGRVPIAALLNRRITSQGQVMSRAIASDILDRAPDAAKLLQ